MANAKTQANANVTDNGLHRILAGGTSEKPEYVVAESVKPVHAKEVAAAGNVLGALAFNVLANMVAPEFLEKGGLDVFPRALKNDKSAFKFLLDQKPSVIREAWDAAQAGRKRYTAPTLQALAKAVKALDKPEGEFKKSVGEQVADIIKGSGTPKAKLDAIAELDGVAKFLEVAEAA